jgi:hypothetical protein
MFHLLRKETHHLCSAIRDGRYSWEGKREDAICLRTITKEQTSKALDDWISPKNKPAKENESEGHRKRSGQRPIVKLKDLKDFNDRYIDDCYAFCKNQTPT